MSIEKDLATVAANSTRIADALEAIAKLLNNPITTSVTTTVAADSAEAPKVQASANAAAKGKEKDKVTAPTPPPPAPEPEVDPLDDPQPVKEIDLDTLREALKGYRSINGAPAMMELLKKHGAESLQALAKDKYQAVYADAIKAE